jgi:uncharacterized RDD family membrane protein YckC
VAELVDLAVIGLACALLGEIEPEFFDTGPWMPALLGAVYVAYHAMFLAAWGGRTPGKQMMEIQVVSSLGKIELSQWQCLARPLVRVGMMSAAGLAAPKEARILFVFMPLLVELICQQSSISRQSFSDIVSRTLVMKIPPLQPHRAPAGPMYSATDAEFGLPPKIPK